MIIIQTKTEDHFLNESLFGAITHDKENKKVRAVEPAPTYYENNFEDVEKVVYTNASNPTLWVSEGSELQRMKKRYDEKIEEMSKVAHQVELHTRGLITEDIAKIVLDNICEVIAELVGQGHADPADTTPTGGNNDGNNNGDDGMS